MSSCWKILFPYQNLEDVATWHSISGKIEERSGRGNPRERRQRMPRVELDSPAPDFALDDFRGRAVRLGDYRDKKHVVLVFNRGFT